MENNTADQLRDSRKIPSFVMIETAVFGRVDPNAFTVYCVIAKHANNQTRQAWPGHRLIASEARCSRSTVKRAIQALQDAKLISVAKKGRVGKEHNIYTLLPAEIKGKKGYPVPTEPGSHRTGEGSNRTGGGFPQSPELDLGELDLPNQTQNRKAKSKTKQGVTATKRKSVALTSPSSIPSKKRKEPEAEKAKNRFTNVGKSTSPYKHVHTPISEKKSKPKSLTQKVGEVKKHESEAADRAAVKHRPENHLHASAPRSSQEPIPPEEWDYLLENLPDGIWWDELKRDRARLRSLWCRTPVWASDDGRTLAIVEALENAAAHDETSQGIFSIAAAQLDRDFGGICGPECGPKAVA